VRERVFSEPGYVPVGNRNRRLVPYSELEGGLLHASVPPRCQHEPRWLAVFRWTTGRWYAPVGLPARLSRGSGRLSPHSKRNVLAPHRDEAAGTGRESIRDLGRE
jgi:hypothetical protein